MVWDSRLRVGALAGGLCGAQYRIPLFFLGGEGGEGSLYIKRIYKVLGLYLAPILGRYHVKLGKSKLSGNIMFSASHTTL